MAEIRSIRQAHEATLLEDGADIAPNLSSLPSKEQLDSQKFRAAVDDAFRTVQHTKVADRHEVLQPSDPVELVRVSSMLTIRNRYEHLEGAINGEILGNDAWLNDKMRHTNTSQNSNTILSFEDYKRKKEKIAWENAA